MTSETQELRLSGDVSLFVLRRPPPRQLARPRRAVVMLHGWPGTHVDWHPVFARLARDQRFSDVELLLPDLRGYGQSDRPPVLSGSDAPYANYAPAAHVADVQHLLEYVRADQVLVAGYDLGANIAQGLARANPDHITGLVLCNPIHPAGRLQAARLNLSAEVWYQHLHHLDWAAKLIAYDRDTVEIYLRHFYTHWWGAGRVDESHFQKVVDVYASPGAFEASIGWYRSRVAARLTPTPVPPVTTSGSAASAHAPRAGQPESLEPGIGSPPELLGTPAQIMWGEADPVAPVVLSETLDQSFSDWELCRLAGVGHFVPLEAPDQVIAAFARLAARVGWLA